MADQVKRKKNFLIKTWKRCRSHPGGVNGVGGGATGLPKSKSCHAKEKKKVAPEGFFPVYVGLEKQRFSVKTKYANHPLFRMLLEDAETEYGYNCDGPILLPCDVDLFYKVLGEMEATKQELQPHGCGFAYASFTPFSPGRRLGNNGSQMAKGYGSYELLTPSRLIKMN